MKSKNRVTEPVTSEREGCENMKCEVCGKLDQDKNEDFCYGCGHIVCTDCCYDPEYDDVIGSPHNIRTHQRVFLKKVASEIWVSLDSFDSKKVEA